MPRAKKPWRKLWCELGDDLACVPARYRGLAWELVRVAKNDGTVAKIGKVHKGKAHLAVKSAIRGQDSQDTAWVRAGLEWLEDAGFVRVDGAHVSVVNLRKWQASKGNAARAQGAGSTVQEKGSGQNRPQKQASTPPRMFPRARAKRERERET